MMNPDGVDYEAALAAAEVLREQLGQMKLRDPARNDVTLGHVFGRQLDFITGSIRLHADTARRLEVATADRPLGLPG